MKKINLAILFYLLSGFLALILSVLIAAHLGFLGAVAQNTALANDAPKEVIWPFCALMLSILSNIFLPEKNTLSINITGPKEVPEIDISRISWDEKGCFALSGELKSKIVVVPSGVGPSFKVTIPSAFLNSLKEDHTLRLSLRDKKGNKWEVGPLNAYESTHSLRAEDNKKILNDYVGQE